MTGNCILITTVIVYNPCVAYVDACTILMFSTVFNISVFFFLFCFCELHDVIRLYKHSEDAIIDFVRLEV